MNVNPNTLGVLNQQPKTFNLSQAGLKFRVLIDRLPNTVFFCQNVTLPGMRLHIATQQTPFQPIPHPGTSLEYDEFQMEFMVDELFQNYMEIWTWMNGLGAPADRSQYASLKNENLELTSQFGGIKSPVTLLMLDSQYNPIVKFTYTDAFPVFLSNLDLDTKKTDSGYLMCSASFAYTLQEVDNQGPF